MKLVPGSVLVIIGLLLCTSVVAWNEPGGNGNNHDPWSSGGKDNRGKRGQDQGPPDLDEALRKLQDRMNAIFGGGKRRGGGSGGSGSGSGKYIKTIALTHGHRDHCAGALELLRAYPSIVESGGFELVLHKESPQELKEVAKQFKCQVTEVEGGETMCSFYDAQGVPILTAAGVLLHCIGAMGFVQTAIEWYEDDPGIFEGDQFFFNDP